MNEASASNCSPDYFTGYFLTFANCTCSSWAYLQYLKLENWKMTPCTTHHRAGIMFRSPHNTGFAASTVSSKPKEILTPKNGIVFNNLQLHDAFQKQYQGNLSLSVESSMRTEGIFCPPHSENDWPSPTSSKNSEQKGNSLQQNN